MPSTIINTSIDTEIDAKARHVLSNLGLSMNEAIILFLNNIVESKKIPFSIDLPNKETIAAIEDARNGNVERYSSLEAMWADLDDD
ncbi:MAG: type II toxin-antitoxin system RelB/DinJ family antitoxin [Methylovulum sp.]|nr:type II toxin-antitoxin system RelB/DinJ family antitoxin [Methylovulum sp.]